MLYDRRDTWSEKQLDPNLLVPSSHSPFALRRSDSLSDASTALSRAQVRITSGNSLGLLDNLLTLGQDQLDVARVRHVGVDLCSC